MLDLKEMPNSTHATLQALTFSKTTNYTLSDLEHFDLGSIESVGRDLLEAHIKLPSGNVVYKRVANTSEWRAPPTLRASMGKYLNYIER